MHRFRWVWLCFVFLKKESCWFHMHQHLECTCARCKVTLCKKETPIYCMSEVHYSNSGCAGSFCQHSINRPRFWATQRAKASAALWCWNQQCHQSRWSETEHTTMYTPVAAATIADWKTRGCSTSPWRAAISEAWLISHHRLHTKRAVLMEYHQRAVGMSPQ